MTLTKEEMERIRNVSIHQILGIQNNGKNISIKCPLHNERTPSFVLYPDNSYHCFGCNANGSGAIDFVMGLGFSFIDSLEELIKYI